MKITVTDGNNFINLEVEEDQLIEDVKALLEIEVPIRSYRQKYHCIRLSYTLMGSYSVIINASLKEESVKEALSTSSSLKSKHRSQRRGWGWRI